MPSTKLLIVDDEETILKQLTWALKENYNIATAQTFDQAIKTVKSFRPDIMILDLSLTSTTGDFEGFSILESSLREYPLLKIIIITGHGQRENALRALKEGAYDFYTKPVIIDELKIILQRATYILSLEKELSNLRKPPGEKHTFEGIIALSKPMRKVFETVRKIAPTDVAVLITGESGTGKELVARAIHARSSRNDMAFVPINCGAIPENLLESELFGHEKGSFTGAHMAKEGKFQAAEGGTLFLDEIGELPQPLQVKILRFLQDQIIEHVGSSKQIQLNVRIVAATNRNLEEMLEKKEFRKDLFYRINTLNIHLPPLREREDDILLLAKYFVDYYNNEFSKNIRGFSQSARKVLYTYKWPGNIRELENRIKRGVIMSSGTTILEKDLDIIPAKPGDDSAESLKTPDDLANIAKAYKNITLKEAKNKIETRLINGALIRSSGNVSATAKQLDVSRPTLHDLMKKHHIDPKNFRTPGSKK